MPAPANFKYLVLPVFFFILHLAAPAQRSRQVLLFNSDWKFNKGDVANAEKEIFDDNNWGPVTLPHDWSIEGPFDEQWASATAYLPGGIGWYRKTFILPATMRGKLISLYFDGVYKNSEVWLNGHLLGKRPNGFIAFQYDITRYLHSTGNNIIAVKADHTEFADSRWYTGSGIYRNVYLVAAGTVHIDPWGVSFSTPVISNDSARAKIAVAVSNHSAATTSLTVKSTLTGKDGKPVGQVSRTLTVKVGSSVQTAMDVVIAKPLMWSVSHPDLYTLTTSIYAGGKKTDDDVQQVGFRHFNFDKNKGFFLNGENMKLKGVCIHDDGGALGVAVPREVWETRLRLLKEAGCNSVRMSHNPHADYLYNLCDSMGLLVMDEAFDEWELGKNKWIKGWNVGTPGQDGYHEYFKEWGDRDLKDMVLRSRNHPSIILWSIGNEIDYPNDPYTHEVLNTGNNPQIYGKGYLPNHPPASRLGEIAKHLVQIIKQADSTRPVTAALAGVVMSNETGYPEALDIVGYNYQEFRYPGDHLKYPERIMYGSENGMNINAWDAVADNDYISGQYLWTGIDYLGEARQWPSRSSEAGLIDLAGFKKPEYFFRQSLWTKEPMIFLGTALIKNSNSRRSRNAVPTWNYLPGDSIRITCFSNCESAELFLNGNSLGKKDSAGSKEKYFSWLTVFQPGKLMVKGYSNGTVACADTLHSTASPEALVAVANITSFGKSKKQLAQVEINVVDENGRLVYDATNEITVHVTGPARLLGIENGSSVSHEDYKSEKHSALHGRLKAYIQSEDKPGTVSIRISSAGLTEKIIQLQSTN